MKTPESVDRSPLTVYLLSRYTPATAKSYEREIKIYLAAYPQANSALYKDIIQHIGTLRKRYTNPKTVNTILGAIKTYYDYLCYSGQRRDNPAKTVRLRDKINRDVQLQDLFTAQELETLLNRKERFNKLDYRNKVLTSLLIYQALHPTDMEAITLNDINLQQASIYIKATRKTNGRELTLKPFQIMLFHQYINEIRPKLLKGKTHEKLLIGQRGEPMAAEDITKHIMRSYKEYFEGRRVTAMTIRQSVITNLLKQGNDLRIVQTFAGHKYPDTTERYKQTNVEALKTAVNQYHPIR